MPTTIPTTTSSTRPGSPSTGDAYFETDTNNYIIYDGANWRGYASDGIIYSFPSNSYSASFDGVNDYIDTNNKFDFIQQTCTFSVTAWIKFTNHASTAANQFLLGNTNSGSQVGMMLWYDNRSSSGSNKQLRVVVSPAAGAAGDVYVNVSNSITDNNWHHIAVTGSGGGGTLKMYRDGSLIGSTSGLTNTTDTSLHDMQIGAVGGASPTNFLGGYLDEVAVFNYELTSTQINSIRSSPYNYLGLTSIYRFENNAVDSVGANNGTNNGATFVTSTKPY
jgi:hypothetical protein